MREPLTGCLCAMSEPIKAARARSMFSFAVSSRRPCLMDAVGRWRGTCDDMEAIAHRMSEAHCLLSIPPSARLSARGRGII